MRCTKQVAEPCEAAEVPGKRVLSWSLPNTKHALLVAPCVFAHKSESGMFDLPIPCFSISAGVPTADDPVVCHAKCPQTRMCMSCFEFQLSCCSTKLLALMWNRLPQLIEPAEDEKWSAEPLLANSDACFDCSRVQIELEECQAQCRITPRGKQIQVK